MKDTYRNLQFLNFNTHCGSNSKFLFLQNCRPNYSTVSKLQYMDMVVNENLRLNNIAAT